MADKGHIRIGISGWRYKGWRGTFYPDGLTQRRELAYAAERLGAIEINGTHYSLQRPSSFEAWVKDVPRGFRFTVKASRYITHMKRLRDAESSMANFFAQGLLKLGPALGPILWQFPPNFSFDPERVAPFLAALPKSSSALAKIAARHDERLEGRAVVTADSDRPVRHAMEIRHDSFATQEFIAMLREHGVALVVSDATKWPCLMDVTADFVYCRLHGPKELYASGYDDAALDVWARRVRAWAAGGEPSDAETASAEPAPKRTARDVFVFFDNDMKVHAPRDAQALMRRIADG